MADADIAALTENFKAAVKIGGKDKKELTTAGMTKWFKQAGCYGKALTTTDTDIKFSAVKAKTSKEISQAQLLELLNTEDIKKKYMKDKKLASQDEAYEHMKKKLCEVKLDSSAGATAASKTGGVDRLTDTSKYTGAHKERFGADGKGKGKSGREEVQSNDGYVGNYKGKDTYDKKK